MDSAKAKGLEVLRKHNTNFTSLTEKIDLNTSLGNIVFILISAIAQLERDLIAERVRNGLANARAKGRHIGRVRKRNSALIESLLQAGLSFREISRIARCSHGSVSAQKKIEELTKNITSNQIENTVEQMKAMSISEEMVHKVQEKLENDARENVKSIQGDVVYDTID